MEEKLKKIKLLIFDIDGVLTDGKLYYTSKGEEIKVFYVRDGVGIWLLKKKGLNVVFITGRKGKHLKKRAKDLGIDLLLENVKEKEKVIPALIKKFKCQKEEVLFMADDVIDIPACKFVGFVACPKDAAEEIKKISDFISEKEGGRGAVREVAEKVLKAKGCWNIEN